MKYTKIKEAILIYIIGFVLGSLMYLAWNNGFEAGVFGFLGIAFVDLIWDRLKNNN